MITLLAIITPTRALHEFIAARATAETCGLTRIYGEPLYVFACDRPKVVVLDN
jgi:hypothetical protein